jgi:hypothetical protein
MGLGNGQSYGAFEQAPMFKNGHTQKAPPGKCLAEESMWNDEETWAECDGMGTPPSKNNTAVLAAASSAPSKLSASPALANKKKAQRKLDAELKSTQVPGPSMDAAVGGGSKSNKTKSFKKDYEFVCSSLLDVMLVQESCIAAVLKEHGRKKTKAQALKEIIAAWQGSGDNRRSTRSCTRVCCTAVRSLRGPHIRASCRWHGILSARLFSNCGI